ncbi:hypothetical protein [Sorangium sp. So ce233]|uniref:hypothetical protein n=1 Tax=Sorangium sp. So ce233 TaxID=3133290 RepID=UPI003F60AD58
MLMRDGDIYFITKSGSCEHAAQFGAPQPDWVPISQGVPMDPSRSRANEDTWIVDLARFDDGLEGCFFYSVDKETELPRLFGGGPCSDWPKGSFIEYSNFRQEETPDDLFAVPSSCAGAEPPDPESSKACWTCHDHK